MPSIDRRRDVQLARAIDGAISLEHAEGAVAAWASLEQLGLSPNTIGRVLGLTGMPRRRRAAIRPDTSVATGKHDTG